jgi:hypothetical protein
VGGGGVQEATRERRQAQRRVLDLDAHRAGLQLGVGHLRRAAARCSRAHADPRCTSVIPGG